MQHLLTKVAFLRSNVDEAIRDLQHVARAAASEQEYLESAADVIATFTHASRYKLTTGPPLAIEVLFGPVAVLNPSNWKLPPWVAAIVPLRFSRGDAAFVLLGPRRGGRRYLSEDYSLLGRLGAAAVENLEQLRSSQMRSLVTQAELRALQSQINPHFLFNSLNTLYGAISRENDQARNLVLNLADIFRFFLTSERAFISIEEEVRIVRAYLEIEKLRLGPRLETHIELDAAAATATIPVLSIQPLVENAVKHGVAKRMGAGLIRLSIQGARDRIAIQVSNSGECDERSIIDARAGIGLSNVRRRLALCYGDRGRIEVQVKDGMTTVGFSVPVKQSYPITEGVMMEGAPLIG